MSSLAPVEQGEQGKKVIYCLWNMERFVGRGAVNSLYPTNVIYIVSLGFFCPLELCPLDSPRGQRWSEHFVRAMVPVSPPASDMSPTAISPPAVPLWVMAIPRAQVYSSRWPGPYLALPFPVSQHPHLATAGQHECLCQMMSCPECGGLRKTHQPLFGCSIKGSLYLCKRCWCLWDAVLQAGESRGG